MIALIILSFFVEKKHIYKIDSKNMDSSDDEKEMDDLQFEESSEVGDDVEEDNNIFKLKKSKDSI